MNEDEAVLELPDFDPKVTRRAVRRGVFRTARVVLAVLLVLFLAAAGLTLVQKRGDRDERMKDVLGTAFKLYNPAYEVWTESCCDITPWSMGFTVIASQIRAGGGFTGNGGSAHTITQDFFGRVGRLPLGNYANTNLSTSLANVGTDLQRKEDIRKVLARLPDGLNALAVIEFATPARAEEVAAFSRDFGFCPQKVVYERRPGSVPITWGATTWDRAPMPEGTTSCADDMKHHLAGFRAWSGLLRDHDDANLRHFDLSLARLRKAANDGLAYAVVDNLVPVEDLRKVVEDPRVRTVRLADVAFDLQRPRG
ncbi:hypothetical protein ACGF0J_01715 [Nonomuraea sp. NPDC047897]|jgi:hypothetical protein|uniref:hypothetical protein n=1 Tax=Nonomuraea sp. NPDC047897 TaxID=3364346 RepID=UPI00371C4F59